MQTEQKKFRFPLVINGTKDELEQLIPKLVDIGYAPIGENYNCKYPTLFTLPETSQLTYGNAIDGADILLNARNVPLILALAASCSNELLMPKEWYLTNNKQWCKAKYGEIRAAKLSTCRPTLEQFKAKFTNTLPEGIEETKTYYDKVEKSTLIPFDLEKAKLGEYDIVYQNCIIDGHTEIGPKEIHFMSTGVSVGLVFNEMYAWDKKGRLISPLLTYNIYDIFLKPKVKYRFIGIHNDGALWGMREELTLDECIEMAVGANVNFLFKLSTDGTHELVHTF